MSAKLAFARLLSSLALITLATLTLATLVTAHEVQPSIGDLETSNGTATLTLRLNAEAFVAGIDLDDLADTNEAEQSRSYDALRALDPAALEARLRAAAPQLLDRMTLRAGDQRLPLTLHSVAIGELGNIELPRSSTLTLDAQLPEGAQSLSFGWSKGYGTLILRQQGVETPFTGYLSGGDTSPEIPLAGEVEAKTALQAFLDYIPVGFEHILPLGLDHILFVLGLYFLSTHLKPLLWQVSAFTLAHTITLAAAALGYVTVPAAIVEPLIAASITYVAVENILSDHLSRWRPVVIFCFGLLHGLGFASVLGDFGLPADQFIPALIGFNVGVEVGQLAVISLAFLAVGLWFRTRPWYRARISVPASCVIACVGAWWFVERVFL